MSQIATLRRWYHGTKASNYASFVRDLDQLLAFSLQRPITDILTKEHLPVPPSAEKYFKKLFEKYKQGVPFAYLTGKQNFWGYEFWVDKDVLIPRPETEELVSAVIEQLPKNKVCHVLDLGTGSGVIAITLSKQRPQDKITAGDISQEALVVAKRNAQYHKTAKITFVHSDWFSAITKKRFDCIISNPPYIAEGDPEMEKAVYSYEPHQATIAGKDGTESLHTIIKQARVHLKKNSYLLLEHGHRQADVVQAMLIQYGYHAIETTRDIQGKQRITKAQWL